jgi:GH25 family lysozyme M1 (1,4-beta-N-acetylmuramidase)
MTIYGVDVASYQGRPDWPRVKRAGVSFAFSKVTEGTGYVNPTWAYNATEMLRLGGNFLPGAYHFLHGGHGAAQARYFLSKAGDVSKMAVALDVEASGADAATSRDWVKEFKRLTGNHPVIGYYPRWYWEQTGRPDLSFFDTVWQSHYVTGSGSPSGLFGKVPATFWATFGGEPISILQFSSSGTVPGISGRCDVNAYKGSLDQLRALALGKKEDDMPLSNDDLEKIRKIVWEADKAKAPTGTDAVKNPTWAPINIGRETYTSLQQVKALVTGLAAKAPDVDEAAIAQAVLSALTPDAIAQSVVDALPADLAGQVLDGLKTRLEA